MKFGGEGDMLFLTKWSKLLSPIECNRLKLSLGNYGPQIESLTIWILSRPNSIVNYDTNPIPSHLSN